MIAEDLILDHDGGYNPQYVHNYAHVHYTHTYTDVWITVDGA